MTDVIFAYYALVLVIVGTIFNFITFIMLFRSTFSDGKKRPVVYYMRTIAILDILMLYGWNCDHYFSTIHSFTFETSGIVPCKILSFINYFGPQASAWIRVCICIDRYMSISRLHRTWFSRPKSVLIMIGSCLTIIFLLNLHFLLFVCYIEPDGEISLNSALYVIYPLWDNINLGVYNIAPFAFMVVFNSGVIYHLVHVRQQSRIQNSQIQHRSISIMLVITTFMFSLMTTPATIAYGFFQGVLTTDILSMLDAILYTYHILSLPTYFITLKEFRQQVFDIFVCCKRETRIGPSTQDTAPGTTGALT